MMDLSIIIVNYNTKEITRNCIKSIYESHLHIKFEIILVDNASTDGSIEMIQHEFPNVTLIKNPDNRMFAKANNQGIKLSKGKFILLLNSDTLVNENNIEKLVRFMEENPKVGCVGPRVLNSDGSVQSEGRVFLNLHFLITHLLQVARWPIRQKLKCHLLPYGYYLNFEQGKVRKVGWISGCCMLIKKDLINKIGLLDENFFFYNEDREFCYRGWKNGFETWVYPQSEIIHLGGVSTNSSVLKQSLTPQKINQEIYLHKITTEIFQLFIIRFTYLIVYSIQKFFISKSHKNEINEKILHQKKILKKIIW
jgi:GT2 family glycosyltransferase